MAGKTSRSDRVIHWREGMNRSACGLTTERHTRSRPTCGLCLRWLRRSGHDVEPKQPSPLDWIRIAMVLDRWRARYYNARFRVPTESAWRQMAMVLDEWRARHVDDETSCVGPSRHDLDR